MGTGYIRNDTPNNIADGNIINAADLDGEFDSLVTTFSSSTGHNHDGTAANGGAVNVVGPGQDLIVSATAALPKTDNTLDLGSPSFEFKDLYLDGTANIDSLVADTADINGGTIDNAIIGGATAAAGTFTTLNANIIDSSEIEVTTIKARDGTAAASIADSTGAITITSELSVDNINISGNALISTNTNGNISLTPNGIGEVDISKVDIDSGAIDGTTIGANSAAEGTFTNLNSTTLDTTNIEVTNIKAKDGTAAGSIANSTGVVTLASSVLTTTDINGGTIDGATIATSDITVGVGKTLDVSAGTLTLANDQISGDKIQGGTIGSTTITTLTSTTGNITNVNATTVDATNVEVTNVKAKDGTAAVTIADSTGVVTVASAVLTTADINGGTIDGATLGTNSPITEAQIDNININGNVISSTNTNGNITITPNGTGKVIISSDFQVDGTTTTLNSTVLDIDDKNITLAKGAANAAAADGGGITLEGPTISATLLYEDTDDSWNFNKKTAAPQLQIDNINIDGNAITSTDTNGNIDLTPNGVGEVNISKVDIDAGAIDNTSIGSSTAASGAFTTLSASSTITGSNLTASQAVFTNASKELVSNAITGTGNVVMSTSPTLVTPALGTPSAAVLTNATGLPVSTGISGLGTGVATFLATPSSANLASAVTDETGTGALVFATSPVLTTPNLGTPSAVTLTNATGLPLSTGVTGDLPFSNLAQGSALSVLGVTGNATADVASIAAGTDHQVLRRSGTAVGFGAVNLAQSAAITGTLPVGNGGTGITSFGTGVATFLGTPSSANLAAAVTDETGTGALVFATSPTLVTPALGTPSALVGTNITGTASGLTAGNVTTNANLTGAVTSVGNATLLGSFSSANLAGALTDETGSGSAVFATSPTLVAPALGTPSSGIATNLTGLPLTTGVTGTLPVVNGGTGVTTSTGTVAVVLSNSPTLVTPALGTPSSAVLTNATDLPISTGVSGLGTGVATFLATPSSANLASAVTDETGTGALVFATSPTLVTPALGTPSALVGTNITGTAAGLTAGNVTTNANLTGAVTSTGNATLLGSFSSANLAGALTDETGSGSAVFSTSPTLVTPALGTPSAAVLTNATGLPVSTGISGLGTGVATFLATPSSSNLAAAVTGETGTGALVFATSPTLVTPVLGTPSSATLTNATGLPISTGVSGLGTNVATALAVNVGSSGAVVTNGGALGTPSSGTLTNATGLPVSTGISGLGANVATFLATPSSANLASAVTDETGTGALVFASTPTLVTPVLGVATATSVNKVTITAPATSATLTIANGKTLTANNTLTLSGTDATTMTFPSTSATIARTDAGQTFTGTQVMTSPRIVTGVNDTNGNELFLFTATGSAVNEVTLANAATGNAPKFTASGGDTNIDLVVSAKGTGQVKETVSSVNYALASQFDIGTAPNEIPLNQYLGSMAYLDADNISFDARGTNTEAQNLAINKLTTVVISADTTLTTTVPLIGSTAFVIVITSGATSRTVTFGTGFKSTGTLATGTDADRRFVFQFISDGTNLVEVSRTAAITY